MIGYFPAELRIAFSDPDHAGNRAFFLRNDPDGHAIGGVRIKRGV